jgi:predicted nucleic acid-binding protein
MTERLLIDTGPIVAILCREDSQHNHCAEVLRALNATFVTCWPVISEAVFLLGGRADRAKLLFRMLTSSAIRCESLGNEQDFAPWLLDFYDRFGEHAPDLADAALIYLAERHDITRVFTLDRRDFAIFRTSDNQALEVVG